jgi:hypothetical protein
MKKLKDVNKFSNFMVSYKYFYNFPFHFATIEIFYVIQKEIEIELNNNKNEIF